MESKGKYLAFNLSFGRGCFYVYNDADYTSQNEEIKIYARNSFNNNPTVFDMLFGEILCAVKN
jgi:hypothetical protein